MTTAQKFLAERIQAGREICEQQVTSKPSLEAVQSDYRKWRSFNKEWLRRNFTTDEYAKEYEGLSFAMAMGPQSIHEEWSELRTSINYDIEKLESISERVPLLEGPGLATTNRILHPSENIFIVHGHDAGAKEAVARLVEKLGLRAIVLHEQTNEGRTLIEKFEHHADVGFAVVLLTPDDLGSPASKPDEKLPRARQNVVFELGFFLGRLGRERVCALYKDGVELPSDYAGVGYVRYDEGGAWRVQVAREMKAAGYKVSLDDAF